VKEVEQQVRCEVDPEVEAATTTESVPARIVMKLKSGVTFTAFVSAPKGSPSRPFTPADHVARFRRELERRWSAGRCDAIVEMSRDLLGLKDMSKLIGLIAS
jgi:2-methylcitrate dehydratase PrpD